VAAGSALFSLQVNLGLRDGQRRSKALNDGGHPRIFTAAKVDTTLNAASAKSIRGIATKCPGAFATTACTYR